MRKISQRKISQRLEAPPLDYSVKVHPKTNVTGGTLSEECRQLMQDFFRSKR
jgi:tRNA(Arg) A34 adenosine deaminase TadA